MEGKGAVLTPRKAEEDPSGGSGRALTDYGLRSHGGTGLGKYIRIISSSEVRENACSMFALRNPGSRVARPASRQTRAIFNCLILCAPGDVRA